MAYPGWLSLLLAAASAQPRALLAHPRYLCLNMGFPGSWRSTDPSTFTQASVDDFLASFGDNRGSTTRKLCISFNMWTLFGGAPASTYIASLNALLALVDSNDLPLSISLDTTQWWQGRPDLWNWFNGSAPGYSPANVANVEWFGPAPSNATLISWRNWGSQFRMTTPHPNFASPAFRAAAAESLAPLAARLAEWYAALPAERRWLLAYVRPAQELAIGTNYYYYPNGNALAGQPPANDPTGGPGAALQLGYAAVCGALGAAAAAATPGCAWAPGARAPPPLSPLQLDAVVSSYLSFAARVLLDAGLPRSKLMVHTGAYFQRAPPCPFQPPSACASFASPAAALIPEAFPGWSLYGAEVRAAADAGLLESLRAVGGAPWGAPEWNIFSGPQPAWEAALNDSSVANNRFIDVQNYQSINKDAGACAAVVAFLSAEEACLVDAPGFLAAVPLNATAWALTWSLWAFGGGAPTVEVRVSSLAATLPSGELAVPDVWASPPLPGFSGSATLSLPSGFAEDHVFWGVAALGCGGAQRMASDVTLLPLAPPPPTAPAAPAPQWWLGPWMCLERCGDSAADIAAQLEQLAANASSFSAVQFEAFNLGPNGSLVVNGLTDVGPAVRALGLEAWAMVSSFPYPPQILEWMRALFVAPDAFISACVAEVQARKLAGLHVDMEPGGGGGGPTPTPQDALDYAAFLSKLASALHAKGRRLSVAAAGWSNIWNLTALGSSGVDLVEFMGTYTANFTTWKRQLDEVVAAVPLEKLVVGLETGVIDAAELALRLEPLRAANVRKLGVWRLGIPVDWWAFLDAWRKE